jgi:adenosylhomocysteine nucleosidase
MVLRYWLQSWLRQKASQTVRQKMGEAVREELARRHEEESGNEPQAEPPACRLGAVFALGIESGGLEDLLQQAVTVRGHGFTAVHGVLARRNVVIVRSGAGGEAAAQATEALIQGHRPEWVVSAGFAGALVPELARHDLLVADGVVDPAGNVLAIEMKLDREELARTPNMHVGRLLTADRVIRLPGEKHSLGQKHQALAVDIETFAVAEVCRRHGVPLLAARIITDAVDDELPPDVDQLARQKTAARQFGAAVGAIWNRPASFKDMYRLKENALIASGRLAGFLESTIKQLIPLPPAKE